MSESIIEGKDDGGKRKRNDGGRTSSEMIDQEPDIHPIEFNGDNTRPKRTDRTTQSARRSSNKGRAELGLGGIEREHEGDKEAKLWEGASVPVVWELHLLDIAHEEFASLLGSLLVPSFRLFESDPLRTRDYR